MSKTTRGFIVFGILVLVVAFLCIGPAFFWLPQAGRGVPLPVIQLQTEVIAKITLFGQTIPLTNTFTSLVVVDLLVLVIVITARRAFAGKKPEDFVPRGFMNGLEVLVEFMYNEAKNQLGERVGWVFPLAMSIFLFILIANWIKLIPGVESVGVMSCVEIGQPGYGLDGYQDGVPGTVLNVSGKTLNARAGYKLTADDVAKCEEDNNGLFKPPSGVEPAVKGDPTKANPNGQFYNVIPFFRALATDLNMPLALAIIVVVSVQVWGVRALGPAYFFKFINIPALGALAEGQVMSGMDFIVGLVEIISELSRLVSLSFRLFGNIFAGGVLLIVMTFLVAGVLPSVFYFLEIFVGLIQAYVFSVLTIIYAAQAVTPHHEEESETHGQYEAESHGPAADA